MNSLSFQVFYLLCVISLINQVLVEHLPYAKTPTIGQALFQQNGSEQNKQNPCLNDLLSKCGNWK